MLGDALMVKGRPSRLGPKQQFLCFILFMKHNNITIYDAFMWNWAESSFCDDVIFIASCINHALVNEICWPSSFERVVLGNQLCELSRCLGFINKLLVEIRKPWKDSKHLTWFNGCKKIYAMKNIVVLHHHGLFIYIDLGYGGSYQNVNIFQHLARLSRVVSILRPLGWLFWVSFRGFMVLGGRIVHHEKDGEVKIAIGCKPWWCHPSIQQNTCRV